MPDTIIQDCDINQLLKQHNNIIHRYANKFMSNPTIAEDIAQESKLKIYKNIKNFQNKCSISSWIYTIVHNTAMDYHKPRKFQTVCMSDLFPNPVNDNEEDLDSIHSWYFEFESTIENDFIDKETRSEIIDIFWIAMNSIKPRYREIIKLFYFDKLSYIEIESKLNVAPGTVKSRLARAKKAIKIQIIEESHKRNFDLI